MTENNFLDKDGLSKYTSELINKLDNKYLSKSDFIADRYNDVLLPFGTDYNDKLIFKANDKYFRIENSANAGDNYGQLTLDITGILTDELSTTILNNKISNFFNENKIGNDKKYYYYLSSAISPNGNNFMYDDNIKTESGWCGSIGTSVCKLGFTDYNNLTFILNNVEGDTSNITINIGTGDTAGSGINNNTLDINNSCTFIIKNFNNDPSYNNIYIEPKTADKIILNSINLPSNAEYFKYTITNLGHEKYLIQQEEIGNNRVSPVTTDETEPELPEVNE